MKFDVFALPDADLNVVGSRRALAPYNAAHEALRAETAAAAASTGLPEAPYESPALTVVCYVGREKEDGKYRPAAPNCVHAVLDPIYRALIDLDVIASMQSVREIRTLLVKDCAVEGFRVVVEEAE